VQIVKWLIEEGGVDLTLTNAEDDTALDLATDPEVIRRLSEPPVQRHLPVHRAAERGDLSELKDLINRHQVACDARGLHRETPLMWACLNGHLSCAHWLVREAGADPDAVDMHGRTALMGAARGGHPSIVIFLVQECHANVKAKDFDHNLSAPQWAVLGDSLEVIDWFTQKNLLDIDSCDKENERESRGNDSEGIGEVDKELVHGVAPSLVALSVHVVATCGLDYEHLPLDLVDLIEDHKRVEIKGGEHAKDVGECLSRVGRSSDELLNAMRTVEDYREWEERMSEEAKVFLSLKRTTARAHILRACGNVQWQ